jgi:hypothetical protein
MLVDLVLFFLGFTDGDLRQNENASIQVELTYCEARECVFAYCMVQKRKNSEILGNT